MQVFSKIMDFIPSIYTNHGIKKESEDGLPDEITTLVLDHLSPLEWMKNCELVCRKWNRLINSACLWAPLAKQINWPLNVQSNQRIDLNLRKQLIKVVEIQFPIKTEDEFYKKIEKICDLMKDKDAISIHYTFYHNPEAYLKLHILRGYQNFICNGDLTELDLNSQTNRDNLKKIHAIIIDKVQSIKMTTTYKIYFQEEASFTKINPLSKKYYFNGHNVCFLEETQNLSLNLSKLRELIISKIDPKTASEFFLRFLGIGGKRGGHF